jgi:hypothetical protein
MMFTHIERQVEGAVFEFVRICVGAFSAGSYQRRNVVERAAKALAILLYVNSLRLWFADAY